MGAIAFLLWEIDPRRECRHLDRFYGIGEPVWQIYRALNDGSLPTGDLSAYGIVEDPS